MAGGEEIVSTGLNEILAECSLDNRLLILSIMGDKPKSVADVRRALRDAGAQKSYTTVKRYMVALKKIGLVDEKRKHFFLTNLGTYVASTFSEMCLNIEVLKSRAKAMRLLSISCLPQRFMHGIKALKHAEYVPDPFSFITEFFVRIQESESSIALLSDKVSRRFYELIVKKVAEGVEYRGINSIENTSRRMEYVSRMVEGLGIHGEELQKFRARCRMREHDSVPMHIIVVDGKIAGINFPYRDGRANLNGAFVSQKREFVSWAEEILNHFWEESREVEF